MGGDNTRFTFNQKKHYNSVRMQQGRVQLDADWNEQMDIQTHIDRTTTGDTVGLCGAPMHDAGFGLRCKNSDITAAGCPSGDLIITKGRYYVDGLLCENERDDMNAASQDDLPADALMVKLLDGTEKKLSEAQAGTYLAYLDVWEREITAIEDVAIQEKALGGPDTATRKKTVWQVKLLQVDPGQWCETLSKNPAWLNLVQGSTGKLKAQTTGGSSSKDPCIVPTDARYLRLENQLYRVEVHKGGSRAEATFKWSRDNASIVAAIEKIGGKKITVRNVGKDATSFASGQWVEILDDAKELKGEPGEMVQIESIDIATREITTKTAPAALAVTADGVDKKLHPKLRRWDHAVDKEATKDGVKMKAAPQSLEGGIAVQFTDAGSTYRTGDYWLIPARASIGDFKGDIEWSPDDFQSPHGIKHHCCPLALLTLLANKWKLKSDCRRIFPRVTELTSLLYVSGDGQEAMPGNKLDWPLQVRVVNGQHPVAGAKVQFTIESGGGTLSVSTGLVESTPDGIAKCEWILGKSGKQRVKAFLQDDAGDSVPGQVIGFNADLSVASEVAYNPSACPNLKEAGTVQAAIDKLCQMDRGGGCAITVGEGGQHETLGLAFEKLKDINDISLCLLPGLHKIEKDLMVNGKNNIKIVGCCASILQGAEKLSLNSKQILLLDLNLQVRNKKGRIILAGDNVSAERCTFRRTINAENDLPIVWIKPFTEGKDILFTGLQWKNNQMNSMWVELPKKVWDYLVPAGVNIPEQIRRRLKVFEEVNPYDDELTFNKAVKEAIEEIKSLAKSKRNEWFDKRPINDINKLPSGQRQAVESFYAELTKTSVDSRGITAAIKWVFAEFYVFHYGDALALTSGVGGWIEDNLINGYVSLHHAERKPSYLSWKTTSEGQNNMKKKWVVGVMKGKDYIEVNNMALKLQGNNLYAIRSNSPFIMKILASILKNGEGKLEKPDVGYKSITLSENIFHANDSGFVCETLIMSGNQFMGAKSKNDVVANVLGYRGVFMGNVAPQPEAVIETMLRGKLAEAANLLKIENF
jgi:hypothetical protein